MARFDTATLGNHRPLLAVLASFAGMRSGSTLACCAGELVAVKVQRPFVLETVTIDLYIIRCAVLESFSAWDSKMAAW